MDKVDCVVVGAGVVGLAIAAQLAKSGREVLVLEQHDCIGSETSSRNSEVIHAGIYYPSDSLKAKLCVQGKQLLYSYCDEFAVPYQRCGKLIVAAHEAQIQTVQAYIKQAHANGVEDLHWLSQAEIADLEPEVETVGGVMSPSTGIVDSHSFMLSLQGEIERAGGVVALLSKVQSIEPGAPISIHTDDFSLQADWVINCAGLTAPDLAAFIPDAPEAFYAKGHYYSYAGKQPFSRLVYPVAQAGGLGVHVTMDLAGQVKFGPDIRWIDAIDYSFDNSQFDQFVSAIRNYYPNLDESRLHPSYTGIRPKVAPAGAPFEDFRIQAPEDHGVEGFVNLLAIESPGLTASLAIAQMVEGMLTS